MSLLSIFSNIAWTIDAAITALQERLRPECRRVMFRAIVLGVPITARCGDPIEWECATGYCREHCHMFCRCGACGCEAEGHLAGEVVYDATALKDDLPS